MRATFAFLLLSCGVAAGQDQVFEAWGHEALGGPQWFRVAEAEREGKRRVGGLASAFVHVEMISVKEGKRAELFLRLAKLMGTFRVYIPDTGSYTRWSHRITYIHEATHVRQSWRAYEALQAGIRGKALKWGYLWEPCGDWVKILKKHNEHWENIKPAQEFANRLLGYFADCKWSEDLKWATAAWNNPRINGTQTWLDAVAQAERVSGFEGGGMAASSELEAYHTGWLASDTNNRALYVREKARFGRDALNRTKVCGYPKNQNLKNRTRGRWELYYSDSTQESRLLHGPKDVHIALI